VTVTGTFSWIDVGVPDGAAAGFVRAGVDRVELDDFRRGLEVAGDAFVARIYTPAEIAHCAGRVDRLATRFAAKEAVSKMLGTGIRGVSWREIEALTSPHGEPHLVLHDRARDRADALGVTSIGISLTHTAVTAEAFVVALCTAPDARQWIREERSHVRAEA
jgi:holo-[acyl-carrier protein] synthase